MLFPVDTDLPRQSSFLVLFILFVIAIETNEPQRINTPELIFMIYGLGFTLEKLAAMQEHGIKGDLMSTLLHYVLTIYFLSVLHRHLGQSMILHAMHVQLIVLVERI